MKEKKELKLWGTRPSPKKPKHNGKELVLLEEYMKGRKVK